MTRPSRARGALGAAITGPMVAVAVTMALSLPALSWPMSTLDEAILLVYPQRMVGGDLPYQDFFAAYGPTYWWSLEGWYGVTGLSVGAMRALGIALHVVLVLGIHHLLRPAGKGIALAGSLLGALLLFRLGAAPYAWVAITALCLWQVAVLRRAASGSRGRAVLGGVLGGLAVGVRPDVALLALVPALPLLWGRSLWRPWLGGLAAGLAPVWLDLVLTPGDLVDNILLGRAGKGAGQSRLPLIPLAHQDRRFLAVLLASVLVIAVAAAATRRRTDIAFALLAVLALPQAFQRADYTHFVYAGLFVLPMLPSVLAALLTPLSWPPQRPAVLGALMAGLVFLLAVPEIPRNILDMTVNGNMQSQPVRYGGRQIPEYPARAEVLERLLPAIDRLAQPGQTLWVFDSNLVRPAVNDVALYFYLPKLRQQAYFMEITPGITTEAGSGFEQDVLSADIAVLVNTPESQRRVLFPYARGGSPEATSAFTRTFCRRATVANYDIFTRCP